MLNILNMGTITEQYNYLFAMMKKERYKWQLNHEIE